VYNYNNNNNNNNNFLFYYYNFIATIKYKLDLKRFSYNVYIRKKIDDEVEFPTENLVLDPIMSDVKGNFI